MHENGLGEKKSGKEPELETVNGLQFKKYQMSWIRDMAAKSNKGDVNEFIKDTVLTALLIKFEKLHGNGACCYPYPVREKLKEDGCESSLKNAFEVTGTPGEVIVLDKIEEIT